MKKNALIIAAALMLGVGIYIGSRSDGLTSSERAELAMQAKKLIAKINQRDFEASSESFDYRMKSTMTKDKMDRVFGAALDTLGEFRGFRRIIVTGKDPSLTEYSVCQVRCQYEKGLATYTILFDDKGHVGGIYLR